MCSASRAGSGVRVCDTAGMDVSLALLADAANTSRDGKLNLLGIFDAIQAPTFPTTHPSMTLVLRLEASAADGNRAHDLDVRFIDADGARLFKIDARGGRAAGDGAGAAASVHAPHPDQRSGAEAAGPVRVRGAGGRRAGGHGAAAGAAVAGGGRRGP